MNSSSSTRASFLGSFRRANLKSSTLILPRLVEMRWAWVHYAVGKISWSHGERERTHDVGDVLD